MELRGFRILTDPRVYPPSEDTYLLIEALDLSGGERALDMGTGTGIVALHMATVAEWVLGVDSNPWAVELARKNARLNGIENVEFRLSDLFSNVPESFDLIAFNAPYLPPRRVREPIEASWYGGAPLIERFLAEAWRHLRSGGRILLLFSSLTGLGDVEKAMRRHGYSWYMRAKRHIFFEDLYVFELRH
ncbi:MAG: protoporphyrinogen oxidase [Thermoplasmata archaeon]|nr:MAG: protoporphyrinogen oxidase [Thermoplasmata archaeon]